MNCNRGRGCLAKNDDGTVAVEIGRDSATGHRLIHYSGWGVFAAAIADVGFSRCIRIDDACRALEENPDAEICARRNTDRNRIGKERCPIGDDAARRAREFHLRERSDRVLYRRRDDCRGACAAFEIGVSINLPIWKPER
ncbi:hypothetical protein D3C71_1525590 [compost metagenome]